MTDLETFIVDCIRTSVDQVFTTMLGAQPAAGEATLHSNAPEPSDGVVSLIGLAGPWTGAGSISCSPTLACRLCSQMLMMEAESVDDEVLDAMAELTNMVIGGVKNDLEPRLGPLGLSIPTVIYGRNFQMKGGSAAAWITAPFECDGEPMLVRLCIAPTEVSHLRPHTPHAAYPVEV
jgi:chemotaxis protein CheX